MDIFCLLIRLFTKLIGRISVTVDLGLEVQSLLSNKFCLCIHQLMDTWVVSFCWALMNNAAMNILVHMCIHICMNIYSLSVKIKSVLDIQQNKLIANICQIKINSKKFIKTSLKRCILFLPFLEVSSFLSWDLFFILPSTVAKLLFLFKYLLMHYVTKFNISLDWKFQRISTEHEKCVHVCVCCGEVCGVEKVNAC